MKNTNHKTSINENERRDKCFSPKLYGFGRRSLKSEEGLVEKT